MNESTKNTVKSIKSGYGIMSMYQNLNYILFLGFLACIYLFNAYQIQMKISKINTLESEVREAQWKYLDAKSELMQAGSIKNIETKLKDDELTFSGDLPVKLKNPDK